jgi:hypothetical protein
MSEQLIPTKSSVHWAKEGMWPSWTKAAALVSRWIASCGFNPAMYGTHALRRRSRH